MPQPVKHTVDAMLDAARDLVLAAGPAAASARAVSLALHAPSGSIYHRFRRRDDLVAATWLRAQDRFLGAYLVELSQPDPHAAGVAAAATVLTWSLHNRQDAALLLRFSLRDLVHKEVSTGLRHRAEANQDRLVGALRSLAERLDLPLVDVTTAVVDLPYALTRRVLQADDVPASQQIVSLRRAATLLLSHH